MTELFFKFSFRHTRQLIILHQGRFSVKDLMRSKNTSGYFSFYVDNISLKHNPLGIFQKFPLNPIK